MCIGSFERDMILELITTKILVIISNVKDPESILTDINLVREYTGCRIPFKKKKQL